jgi:crotonobetainyl-CoA:carnitine CoA-transferase CaiB-like acyl-CoA transferase
MITAARRSATLASMRPLAGIRVIEAASYVSGPFAGLALADLGAEVIKVEPPTGDPYRRFGPQDGDGGVIFRAGNRNKQSVAIDLTTADGRARLHGLLDEADVLITNWRPGVAEAFGLTSEAVTRRWPQLIWIRVSGYGQTGPMATLPAFDSIVQARVGFAAANGEQPRLSPSYIADKVTATFAAQSALAAIVQRGSIGRGCVVDLAMLDALAYFDTPDLFAGHQTPGVEDGRVMSMLSAPRTLPTADGWIVLAPVSGQQIKRALVAAGLGDLLDDMRSQPDPIAASHRFFELFGDHLRSRTSAEWAAVFAEADVPASAVMSLEQHLADEQVVHNGIYRTAELPAGRQVRYTRHPALFDGAPVETDDLPCPALERPVSSGNGAASRPT